MFFWVLILLILNMLLGKVVTTEMLYCNLVRWVGEHESVSGNTEDKLAGRNSYFFFHSQTSTRKRWAL